MGMIAVIEQLELLRPGWLLALLPWLIWVLHSHLSRTRDPRWSQVIEPELLDALATGPATGGHDWVDRLSRWALRLAVLLGIVALAGPSWREQPAPVFQASTARVLVLDLSQSMNAQDLPPSRLARARFAAMDLIDSASDGRLAVVAFAGTAHAVVPLTTDHRTAKHLIGTLAPDLMPVPGSAIATGLRQALALMEQGQALSGDVILLTDSAPDEAAQAAAQQLADAGYRLSVVGFGTQDGAPIPSDRGGWVHDRSGRMTLARLDEPGLRRLAAAGGGRYQPLPNQALTLEMLGVQAVARGSSNSADHNETRRREDAGPWLVLLVLPLALLGFRRGAPWLATVALTLALTDPVYALGPDWLWRNADQRGQDQLQAGQPEAAMQTFKDPNWKGTAAYQAGDYEAAIDAFSAPTTADQAYNLGNALARAGQLDAAIEAYGQALALDPTLEDAAFNKALVEQLQQQQASQQSPSQDPSESSESGQDNANPSEGGESDAEDAEGNPSDPPGDDQRSQGTPSAEDSDPQSPAPDDAAQNDPAESADAPSASTEDDPAGDADNPPDQAAGNPALPDPASEAEQAAVQQWLRRVPDDPGGLLRNKFLLEQQRREARRQREANE